MNPTTKIQCPNSVCEEIYFHSPHPFILWNLNKHGKKFSVKATTQFIEMKLHGSLACDIGFLLLNVMLTFGETWQNHRYLFHTRFDEFQNQLECRGGKTKIYFLCQESHPDPWVIPPIWQLIHNPYPTAFPYGNGIVLHFYQQQESSTTKTVHRVINKGLKAYV